MASVFTGQRLQGFLFHSMLLAAAALLAWLSLRHAAYWDWTENHRNSLSEQSLALLGKLQAPLLMTSYAPDNPRLRKPISRLLQRYRRAAPERVEIRFIDPELHPEQARQAGVELAGELVLEYLERSERLKVLSEEQIGNALLRLLGRPDRWIAGLLGHGERDLAGAARHDLGDFGQTLERNGYRVQGLDMSRIAVLPQNLGLLVLAGPRRPLAQTETRRLREYVEQGGNLLWLMDPDGPDGLESLAETLGIRILPGRIVDANVAELSVDDPTVALVSNYPDHPATRDFELISLYPQSLALEFTGDDPGAQDAWRASELLRTLPRSWNETGAVQGRISQEAEQGEKPGPLTLGLALERVLSAGPEDSRRQRVLVVGDGDFLANAFLDTAGNRELGLRLVRWLLEEDVLLRIPPRIHADRELRIDRGTAGILGLGVLVLAPLGFAMAGLLIRRARNRA